MGLSPYFLRVYGRLDDERAIAADLFGIFRGEVKHTYETGEGEGVAYFADRNGESPFSDGHIAGECFARGDDYFAIEVSCPIATGVHEVFENLECDLWSVSEVARVLYSPAGGWRNGSLLIRRADVCRPKPVSLNDVYPPDAPDGDESTTPAQFDATCRLLEQITAEQTSRFAAGT